MMSSNATPPRYGADAPIAALSCVVDDTPQIWSSIVPWLATAVDLSGIDPSRIFVHHACELRPDIFDLCRKLGVNTRAIDPFDPRSPHSNKILQHQTDFGDAQRIVLTDVDMVFSTRIPLEQIRSRVAGKPVDGPNPPLHVLERIFAETEIPAPARCRNTRLQGTAGLVEFETLIGNFNGGLYVIDSAVLVPLGRRWAYWAHWLMDRIELLEKWKVHVDQVSFCLALRELELETQLLTETWNFATHREMVPSEIRPCLLHHHGRLDKSMKLMPTQAPQATAAIADINECIQRFQREHFDNRTFWNHRYAHHPSLGSGLGSRGATLELKRELLKALATGSEGCSVLDWGCGDIETVRTMPWNDYLGVDVSGDALRIASEKRPDWIFMTPEHFDAEDGASRDLVLCLDVLIHQPTPAEYDALVQKVLMLAGRGALIAGYDRDPEISSAITYFHEPLGETLARSPHVALTFPLLKYRDTTLFFVAVHPVDSQSGAGQARMPYPGSSVETARSFLTGAL